MMEKKTVIDRIEITRDGHIQIRFGLLIVEDGLEIDCKWHRTIVPLGGDVEKQIAAVNGHLASMGKARLVDAEQLSFLKSVTALAQTPERVAAYRARVAEAEQVAAPQISRK